MWTLLDLAGSVALLLWGVHMVQTGIQRAFGARSAALCSARRCATGWRAFAAGLGVTAILQSSTATGLMVAGFAAGGAVALVPALAVMLGANVGTTLIVQVLSFDVAEVAPALILLGVILFRRGTAARTRDIGRVAIGLGLMLMALHRLVTLVTPYEDMPSLRLVLGAITTEPVLDVLVAAGPDLGGALLGRRGAAGDVIRRQGRGAARRRLRPGARRQSGHRDQPGPGGRSGDDPVARRLPIGNLLNRALGCVVALVLLRPDRPADGAVDADPARAVADFHTGFNLIAGGLVPARCWAPMPGCCASCCRRGSPRTIRRGRATSTRRRWRSPPIALGGGGARGAAHGGRAGGDAGPGAARRWRGTDRRRIAEVRRLDDVLDRLNTRDQGLSDRAGPEDLSEADHRRCRRSWCSPPTWRRAGDVVDRDVMGHWRSA